MSDAKTRHAFLENSMALHTPSEVPRRPLPPADPRVPIAARASRPPTESVHRTQVDRTMLERTAAVHSSSDVFAHDAPRPLHATTGDAAVSESFGSTTPRQDAAGAEDSGDGAQSSVAPTVATGAIPPERTSKHGASGGRARALSALSRTAHIDQSGVVRPLSVAATAPPLWLMDTAPKADALESPSEAPGSASEGGADTGDLEVADTSHAAEAWTDEELRELAALGSTADAACHALAALDERLSEILDQLGA